MSKNDKQHMTVVYDVTKWSDTRTEQLVHSKDVVKVSCSNAVEECESLRGEVDKLQKENKRLSWILKEQD